MNIERSPVVNDGVLLRRDCNDTYLRMLAKQLVTNGRPLAGLVERDNHEIWQSSLHALGNLRLVADFSDNFDVGLIGKCREYELSHETGTIRHEDPDSFLHCVLRARLVRSTQGPVGKCPFFQLVRGDSKNGYPRLLVRLGSCTKVNLRDTKNDPISHTRLPLRNCQPNVTVVPWFNVFKLAIRFFEAISIKTLQQICTNRWPAT